MECFGNVTSAGWQVTLCDLTWYVSSHNSEQAAILCLLALYLLYRCMKNKECIVITLGCLQCYSQQW